MLQLSTLENFGLKSLVPSFGKIHHGVQVQSFNPCLPQSNLSLCRNGSLRKGLFCPVTWYLTELKWHHLGKGVVVMTARNILKYM